MILKTKVGIRYIRTGTSNRLDFFDFMLWVSLLLYFRFAIFEP